MNPSAAIPLRHHPGAVAFEAELIAEHLDECEFLLEQRVRYLQDPQLTWPDIEGIDRRLVAHVAALQEYGAMTITACTERLAEGAHPGALLALASMPGVEPQQAVAAAVHDLPEEHRAAAAQALQCAEQPRDALRQLLRSPRPELRSAAAQILGHRREPVVPLLVERLDDGGAEVRAQAALALLKLGQTMLLARHEQRLLADQDAATGPLLLALLGAGSRRAEQLCRERVRAGGPDAAQCMRLLALLGRDQDVALLLACCADPRRAAAALRALGWHGSPRAVPALLAALSAPDHAEQQAAAAALRLVTGEAPVQLVPVQRVDPDDLLEPQQPAVAPRLSTDPGEWQRRWQACSGRLSARGRYRLGRPWTLQLCADLLLDPGSDYELREHASLELLLHDQAPGIEPDWLFPRQEQALSSLRAALF